jgi:hypothetical protein
MVTLPNSNQLEGGEHKHEEASQINYVSTSLIDLINATNFYFPFEHHHHTKLY